MPEAAGAGGLWRRALQALAHAFDAAREIDDHDTVFQTARRPERDRGGDDESVEPCSRAKRRPDATLQ
jgi:hypothetical protein